jgi:dolichol-phosphate mannosyltransferase
MAVRNAAGYISDVVAETSAELDAAFREYEIILVDDGSEDETVAIARDVIAQTTSVRILVLSRWFGDDIAITAGLDTAIGDVVVTMLARSDPPGLIAGLVDRARSEGRSLVGIAAHDSGRRSVGDYANRFILAVVERLFGAPIPRGVTQFRVLSRRAVGALLESRDRQRSLALLTAHVGYGTAAFRYSPRDRAGNPPVVSLQRSLSLAIDLSVAGGRRPLRLVSAIGMLGSLANFAYACYVVLLYLFGPGVVEGWTTLSLELSVMFFLLFLLLTVMAEYLGHLLAESRDRPLYYVLDEFASPAPLRDPDRLNIVDGGTMANPKLLE